MIVTISGAACTGKTTLLDYMQTVVTGNSATYYSEFIRHLYNEEYRNKYQSFSDLLKGDPLDIIKIHKDTARLFNEVLWSSNLDSMLVFDRSPIDIAIYLYMNIAEYLTKDSKVLSEYRKAASYVNRCISDFLNHEPIIFYTRPFSDEVEEDGFRPDSLIKKRELELALFDKEFLSLPGVHVLPSDLKDRLHIIESVLR